MTKVLVTGASGFIGTATCRELRDAGFAVRAGLRSTAGLRKIPANCEYAILENGSNAAALQSALEGCDAVIHLAGKAHDPNAKPEDFVRVNVEATAQLVSACERAGIRRFIYVSSVKAVAERTSPGKPLTSAAPARPEDPYGRSKLEAESIVASADPKMDSVIVRPPLVYGRAAKGNFPRLVRLVGFSRIVPLPFGAASARRSCIFVGNLAHALRTAVAHPVPLRSVFFVSDGPALTTANLMREIGLALGFVPKLFDVEPRLLRFGGRALGMSDVIGKLLDSLEVDDALFRGAVRWTPPFTVREGINLSVGAHVE